MSDAPERWTQATVYPDMWVNPDEDPRGDDVSADGELPTLRDYFEHHRLTLRMKCEGLSPEQLARRSVPPSTMSLLGLVRHLAETERHTRNWVHSDDQEPKIYGTGDAAFEDATPDPAVVAEAFATLDREEAATDALLAAHPDLTERVGRIGIAIRELWTQRIAEYARHCGHADLLRECIDGRVGQ